MAYTANKYGVSAGLMDEIIGCESQWNVSLQSYAHYTAKNVPKGFKVGDREQSWGLVQIHLPAHPNITKAQALNPVFAANFLAENIAAGNPEAWSCYSQNLIAMRQ